MTSEGFRPHAVDNFGIIPDPEVKEVHVVELGKAFYSPAEVAAMIDVHPTTILNYIRDDKLYAIRLSERTIRIPARSVLKLLAPEEVSAPRHVERPHEDVRNAVTTSDSRRTRKRVPA